MNGPEEWRTVLGSSYYEVSSHGRVRGARGMMKPRLDRKGYKRLNLRGRGAPRSRCVHHLVAEAFIGARPAGLVTNHIDGDKLNNTPANLEYVTAAENERHCVENGLKAKGERHGSAKLTAEQVLSIRASNRPTAELARKYRVAESTLHYARTGSTWTHL